MEDRAAYNLILLSFREGRKAWQQDEETDSTENK